MLASKSISRIVSTLVVLSLLLTSSPVQAARYTPSQVGMPPDPFTGCNNQSQLPLAECEALVIFYNSTGGPNWNMYTQWLQTNTPCGPALWFGITCANGHVTQLKLGGRNLTGSIPPELANLTELQDIDLSDNFISGGIPSQLGTLTQLKTLVLWGNPLGGSIPPTLGNLAQLQNLDLYLSGLTGSIPPELGNLTQLTRFEMSMNQLSGTIPPELGNLTQLTILDLYGNQLTGSIPPELGNLSNLSGLVLAHNQLTGSIPPELGSLTELSMLYLYSNPLSGPLPSEAGNWTKLQKLSLEDTQLSGEIPASVTNLTSLAHLSLPCGLTSTNPTVISFVDQFIGKGLAPTWNDGCPAPTSTPTVTPTPTETFIFVATYTLPPTLTRTLTVTPTITKTNTATQTPSPSPTRTPSPTTTKTKAITVVTLTSIAAQDGWILESAETSSLGGTLNSTSSLFKIGDDPTKKQYRSILSFNTGAVLPDNASITNITLQVWRHSITGGGLVSIFQGFIADLKKGFFGTSALETSDFQAMADKSYGPFIPSLSNNWYSINLTDGKASINKLSSQGGLTQIRLRFKLDDNNNTISNYLSLYSGNASADSRPQLVITYTVP